MNMNNPLENLRQLTEAVRMAGADIAPTYIEYVQLAFAIANDCGEAGRNDFLSLCSLSSKYDEKNAQALFSNALHADKEDIHLGTVFHLAGQCGVKISGSTGSHKAGTMGTAGTAPDFPHTCARYYKVENNISDDTDEEEQLTEGSDPYSPLPTFPQNYVWPELLERIISFGKIPNSVMYCSPSVYRTGCLLPHSAVPVRPEVAGPLYADFHRGPVRLGKKRVDMGTAPHRTHTRQDTQRGERGDENLPPGKGCLRLSGQGTEKSGSSRIASQPDVPHIGKQHRNRHPAKYHGFQRNGHHLRK